MYYSKGKLAECGSKIRKGWIAPATATAVERLEAAGSFRLGAAQHGRVRLRPDRPQRAHRQRAAIRGTATRITGGSSSGSGSAVGGAAGAGGARLRHRRLDPHAGAFLRRERLQADQRPRQPRQLHAALVHARYRRPAGADRGRLRASSCRIIAGPDPLDPTTAPAPKWDAQGDEAPRQGPDHRHSEELLCRRPRTGRREGARRRDRDVQEARREGRAGRSAGPGAWSRRPR